jgi:hypothetical protein
MQMGRKPRVVRHQLCSGQMNTLAMNTLFHVALQEEGRAAKPAATAAGVGGTGWLAAHAANARVVLLQEGLHDSSAREHCQEVVTSLLHSTSVLRECGIFIAALHLQICFGAHVCAAASLRGRSSDASVSAATILHSTTRLPLASAELHPR